MQEITTINGPTSGASTAIFGGFCAASALTWVSSLTIAGIGKAPTGLLAVLLSMAITSTVLAAVFSTSQVTRDANTQQQAIVSAAVGQIAAEVEQVHAKVEKIDPWTIYTAVAADILNENPRKQQH